MITLSMQLPPLPQQLDGPIQQQQQEQHEHHSTTMLPALSTLDQPPMLLPYHTKTNTATNESCWEPSIAPMQSEPNCYELFRFSLNKGVSPSSPSSYAPSVSSSPSSINYQNKSKIMPHQTQNHHNTITTYSYQKQQDVAPRLVQSLPQQYMPSQSIHKRKVQPVSPSEDSRTPSYHDLKRMHSPPTLIPVHPAVVSGPPQPIRRDVRRIPTVSSISPSNMLYQQDMPHSESSSTSHSEEQSYSKQSKGSSRMDSRGSPFEKAKIKKQHKTTKSPSSPIDNTKYNTGTWTRTEHEQFVKGLEEVGKNWKEIAESYVKTRKRTQIASHAQKWFLKLAQIKKGEKVDEDDLYL